MPSWLFFFHPLVRHERHPYFFTILTRWFKSDTDTFIVFALACVNVFPSDWRPGRGPDSAAVRAVRLSAPLSQLTHVTGVSSTDTLADMLSPLYEVLLRMFGWSNYSFTLWFTALLTHSLSQYGPFARGMSDTVPYFSGTPSERCWRCENKPLFRVVYRFANALSFCPCDNQ